MELNWLRIKLYEWGCRNRAQGIGYPNMSSHEKALRGRGGRSEWPSLPPDLQEIDQAVLHLEPEHKLIIAECYTHYGTHDDHMIRLRLNRATYFRKKNLAESRVYWCLQRLAA